MKRKIYGKNSKNWNTSDNYHSFPKIGIFCFFKAVYNADGRANSVDPDQTAP